MRVKIFAPAWIDHSPLDRSGYLEIDGKATLAKVYDILKIPHLLHLSIFCTVNYERVKMDTLIQDGDVIAFIVPISGG